MKKIILPFLFLIMTLSSCMDKATITIQNNRSNDTLERVSWDTYFISRTLLPGEKSTHTISDIETEFPKEARVKFYMKRDGYRAHFETRYRFILDIDDNLLIIITDTTRLIMLN